MGLEQLYQIFRMSREETEREFSPYFYIYFRYCYDKPEWLNQYSQFCKHIFETVQAKGKKVLDIGCGFGLISIHLAALGARMVSAVDANEEKYNILRKILSRFNPPLDNIEARLGDALALDYEDGYFDIVIANEAISHVRDTDIFIQEVSRILRPGGIFYVRDGNNSLDIVGHYRRRKFWKRREYGPVDMISIRGTEPPVPWQMVRKEIIQGKYPRLDARTAALLAKETAGMYGDEIGKAVAEYLKDGRISTKPAFKFRDPVTGEYNEFEFNPYTLKKKLESSGFSARVARPYFTLSPFLSIKDISINLAKYVIRVFYPLSTIIAPHFEIMARKK